MVQGKYLRDELEAAFAKYQTLERPRLVGILVDDDVDVDMWADDSSLVGLVTRFLAKSGLDVERIVLDGTVDDRLERLSTRLDLRVLQTYRREMRALALLLSQVSGIPLEYRRGARGISSKSPQSL